MTRKKTLPFTPRPVPPAFANADPAQRAAWDQEPQLEPKGWARDDNFVQAPPGLIEPE
jgi:hypothetical protein